MPKRSNKSSKAPSSSRPSRAADPQLVKLPELHAAQVEVLGGPARFKVVAAGRRWGKGVLGVGECVRRAGGGQHCWWIAPTFASAAYQAGWRMAEFYQSRVPGAFLNLQRRMLCLAGGGWVQFKTAEEPDSLRGESIDFAVVDEAAHIPKLKQIWELCLRPCLMDRRGGAWFVSTPAGLNYFYELYRKRAVDADWESHHYPSASNPHLDRDELDAIVKDLPVLMRRQEVGAEFVQLAGALFSRDSVQVIEAVPPGLSWVRAWDLAFKTKTANDWTAGVKAAFAPGGTVVVANVVHGRWEWPQAVKVVADTARLDGQAVRQGVETVGAQVGFLDTLLADPQLAGLSFQPISVHADKVTRALPAIARCEQGRLALVRGPWCEAFLDELSSFPEGTWDDQVDGLSGAMQMLGEPTGALESAEQLATGPSGEWVSAVAESQPSYTDMML